MNIYKGFINPIWLLAVLLVLIGGGAGAYWYAQQSTVEATAPVPVALPVAGETKSISQEPQRTQSNTDIKEGSTYTYNGAEYKVVDTAANPFVEDGVLVIAVKTQLPSNQCGGLYDDGPCEFFLESTRSQGPIHAGTLKMGTTFKSKSIVFTDVNTVTFEAHIGDGGVYVLEKWRAILEPWSSIMLDRVQTGEAI